MQQSSGIVRFIQRTERHLCPLYCGVVDRRRVIAYLFLSLIETVLIPLQIVWFLVRWEPYGFCVTLVHLSFFMVIQMAIWKRDLGFEKGIAFLLVLVFLKLAVDCIFVVVFGQRHDDVSVLGNIFIMFILAISALSLMLTKTTIVITIGMTPILALYVALQSSDTVFLALKSVLVGAMMVLYVFSYNMSRVNKGLRQPREIKKEERKALEMLANLRDIGYNQAETLMERLTPELRQRIILHAKEHLKKEEEDELVWDMVCVGLTKTEKEVCKLVLQNKTLKEICAMMGKSESNVTSTRCHIRKKLGMERADDLKRTLEQKVAEVRNAL